MKTMTKKDTRPASNLDRTRNRDTNPARPQARNAESQQPQPRPALIESEEYEWISARGFPGLIVSPSADQPASKPLSRPIWPHLDGVIETEDGDATSFCQLPGRLTALPRVPSHGEPIAPAPNEGRWGADEYTHVAAMQMPGLLVEPIAQFRESGSPATARGLCATCANRVDCSFPKPSSGVWRCEEYA